jgi:hypothetical protein
MRERFLINKNKKGFGKTLALEKPVDVKLDETKNRIP